jgi:hypothetical protein
MVKNASLYRTAISFTHFFPLLLRYLAGAAILYFILFLLFAKKNYKAALFCTALLTVYFFYSNFDTFLQRQSWLYPFSRYRWSLPTIALILFIAFFYIRRLQRPPERTIGFLNILLILFCLSEALPLLYKSLSPQKPPLLTIEKETVPARYAPVTSIRPNIYFLLLDEYQGNAGLQKIFNYPNTQLKNTLSGKGFFSPQMARSNYNMTFFSMPSIFNMNYLDGEIQGTTTSEDLLHFSSGIGLIRDSRLIGFLKNINYKMIDLSPFPLDGSGETVSQFESVVSETSLFTDQTLFHFVKEKFSWMIPDKRILRFLNPSDYIIQYYNEYVREHLLAASAAPRKDPRFVYAHFFIPHAPFLKDSSGNDVNFKELTQKSLALDKNYIKGRYLDYLKYANSMLINSIDTLIKNDPGSIILVMSDHGYRNLGADDITFQFNNQFYIRTPEQNYSGWPDTVDAVNAFRILLNNEFNQKLEYLPYRKYEFTLPRQAPAIYQR